MHQVNRAAQKTDAQQLTRNLLLTKNATVNVKPNLQIVADDVKCTHGCTVRARVGRSATTTHLTHRPPLLGAPMTAGRDRGTSNATYVGSQYDTVTGIACIALASEHVFASGLSASRAHALLATC
jgi:hypothetical protein